METVNSNKIVNEIEKTKQEVKTDSKTLLKYFIDEIESGNLCERKELVNKFTEYENWEIERTRRALIGLTSDDVDPVQSLRGSQGLYVGIIDYKEFEELGGYGFIEYDDLYGKRIAIVCSRCVEESDYTENVSKARSDNVSEQAWEELKNILERHYEDEHEVKPSQVSVGATLVSGTTIASSTAWHDGNVTDGTGVTISGTRTLDFDASEVPTGSTGFATRKIGTGEFASLVRLAVPAGRTLELRSIAMANDSFNAPTGLRVVIRNESTNTNLDTFNTTFTDGDPLNTYSVGGDNVIIGVDNGSSELGGLSGTGSNQFVNCDVEYGLI